MKEQLVKVIPERVNCPKCGKRLVDMELPELKYCVIKKRVECFGKFDNRKFRIEELPDSGCGTLFKIPIREKFWNEDRLRFEIW